MKLELSRTTALIGAFALVVGGMTVFAASSSAAVIGTLHGSAAHIGELAFTPDHGNAGTQPTWGRPRRPARPVPARPNLTSRRVAASRSSPTPRL